MADRVTVTVQPTPNVNALKFVLNRRLTEGKSQTFRPPSWEVLAAQAEAVIKRHFAAEG